METQLVLEKWAGVISTLTIGADAKEGGTRANTVKIGGQKSLPLLFKEGDIPNPTAIAFEIWDVSPLDWPEELVAAYGKALDNPFDWADKCINEFKAKLLCVRMQGAHPDFGNKGPKEAAEFISILLSRVKVPLIIIGCGDDAKDNQILPACSESARNERCLIGCAVQENYKTLVASIMADGHNIIAESPIDINIAKQLNILISDMGLNLERIAINPTIGALGYGLEYAYSIMERARLAGLSGDKTLASPFICFAGQESWRAKEARISPEQGIIWEIITATSLMQAGADLLILRHPEAAKKVSEHIDILFKNKS
ncbi:MAG: acetyl-CoA decarbonylase/synthase complex subunit delta [Candidatus Omnitrophica bacterium]|jgi:acetyl-CoA decarbonylase/synthase complex subunit delta|nr:acetyl-CoA decarbonylase/synthase complex subunit delta [Candidatus Omnitrophota bacterium]